MVAFYAETHEQALTHCEPWRTNLFRGFAAPPQVGHWWKIGSNTYNLVDDNLGVRFQLFHYEPTVTP